MVYIGIFNEYAVLWNTETYILSFIGEEKSLLIPHHRYSFQPCFS